MRITLSILSIILLGAGCTTVPTPTVQDADTDNSVNSDQAVIPDFVVENVLPDTYVDYELLSLDFENDGVDEYALQYKKDDVVRKLGNIRTISYIKVYQWDGVSWSTVKEDEVTSKGGTVDTSFQKFEVVQLGDSDNDHLWVSKYGQKSNVGYYVYGLQADGTYGDWSIPKGYLNSDDYIGEGDLWLDGNAREITREGILESYQVFCEDREPFGAGGRSCWGFDLFIPFDGEFGQPIMQNKKQY